MQRQKGEIRKCQTCGKEVYVPFYRLATFKYCSRSCLATGYLEQKTSVCAVCGKEFQHIASRMNKAKYCSRGCYYKAQHLKGTKEYTCCYCGKKFLGSPSSKRKYCSVQCNSKNRKSEWKPTFATVRKNLIARGKIEKCEICGYDAHPEILGVHHKDRNRNNNALSNLMVLCPTCHSLEHRKHIVHGWRQ